MFSSAPAENGTAVTPSDTTILSGARALWVGTAGNLSVVFANDKTNGGAGTAVTISNVPVGLWSFAVKQVRAATTASNIVALY